MTLKEIEGPKMMGQRLKERQKQQDGMEVCVPGIRGMTTKKKLPETAEASVVLSAVPFSERQRL